MYTNEEFNEENQEGYLEEQNTTSYDSGNKTKLIFIIALVIILIILIVLVLSKKGVFKKEDHYVLNISPENVVVPYGETKNIAYEVRNNDELVPNAVVTFTIENEEVATINNNNVTGVSYGKTGVYAIYKDEEGKTVQKYVDVTVADGDPNTPITNVVFPEGDLQMPVNSTYDIVLGIEPPNGYVESKKFRSSNNNIVTVDNVGKVTAVSEGEATIKIDVNNSAYTKGLKVYVNNKSTIPTLIINPTKIIIGTSIEKIVIGDSKELEYAVEPANADKSNIVWSSSNPAVLTVDETGKITGIKEGTSTVRAEAPNGINESIKIKVEQSAVEITEITLDSTEVSLVVGEMQAIVPTIVPEEATDKTLTYTSSNPAVATVESNMDTTATITAVSTGSATISIKTSNNIEKTINVTVSDAAPYEPGGESGGSSGGSSGSCSKCKDDCGAGKYCNCGKCIGCPAGNYCASNKKTACPAGKGSVANASSYQDCTSCAKGYYSEGKGKGCVACPSNKTTSGTGSTSKSACNIDISSSTVCAADSYLSGSNCVACPRNYKSRAGSTSINNCYISVPSGKKLPTARSSTFVNCPAGTYSTGTTVQYGGTSDCTPCAKGYYQDQTGQYKCTKCPDGKTTAGTGSTSSSACNVTAAPDPVITCLNPRYNGRSQRIANCSNGTIGNAYRTTVGTQMVSCIGNGKTVNKTCALLSVTPAPAPTPVITCINPTYNGRSQRIANCSNGTISNAYRTSAGSQTVSCTGNGKTVNKTCSVKAAPATPAPTADNRVCCSTCRGDTSCLSRCKNTC